MTFFQFIIFKIVLIFVYVNGNNLCCPPGQALLRRRDVCWEPKTNKTSPIFLQCNETIRFKNHFTTNDKLQLNLVFDDNSNEIFNEDTYCLGNTTTIRDVTMSNTTIVAVLCLSTEEQVLDDKILGYCMIVSVLFLVPTAFIYTALPELRDVQGKSIINFCTSLAIGQGILVIMKLMEYSDMALCATRGFLAYFFIMAAFFWTNAIAIQILLNTRRPSTLDYSWHEFKWYFLYAWGIPVTLTVCMAIVNFHPGDHIKPGIGLNHCWFLSKAQQWYYMFSIMSLLLAANIAIFIYTSLVIWQQTFTSTHLRALKYKFVMTMRLILLLGLPWVFEMVGSLVGQSIIFSIIDVFNCLQGALIFLLLVVFRRRVIKMMYKHGWLDCISRFVEKRLALEEDEENVVQHTDVPIMTINDRANGRASIS